MDASRRSSDSASWRTGIGRSLNIPAIRIVHALDFGTLGRDFYRIFGSRSQRTASCCLLLIMPSPLDLARLRNCSFFSLRELNSAIAQLLSNLNTRPFKRRAGSRASLSAELERPALRALPTQRYEFARWKKAN